MSEKNFYHKERQFLPGPTAVWSQGKRPQLTPSTYHRSPEFQETLKSVRAKLAPFLAPVRIQLFLAVLEQVLWKVQ